MLLMVVSAAGTVYYASVRSFHLDKILHKEPDMREGNIFLLKL